MILGCLLVARLCPRHGHSDSQAERPSAPCEGDEVRPLQGGEVRTVMRGNLRAHWRPERRVVSEEEWEFQGDPLRDDFQREWA